MNRNFDEYKLCPFFDNYDELKKNKDSNYLTLLDINISTDKLDRILKVLEESEIIELFEIFENTNSNSSEKNFITSDDKVKRNVAKNLFIYELFIMKYLAHLLKYKHL